MNPSRKLRPFPWVLASVCSIILVGALVMLVKPPATESEADKGAVRPLELLPLGTDVRRAESQAGFSLRDPVPLYLPTSLNAGQIDALMDDGRREPVAAFNRFPARLNMGESGPRVGFAGPVEIPGGPVEALNPHQRGETFRYLGRRTTTLPEAAKRLGFLEITRAENGELVLRAELPAAGNAPPVDWAPVDMVVAVNRAGLMGLPFITRSSGSAQFDSWLPGYLASTYRLGERLRPGNYRISLGP